MEETCKLGNGYDFLNAYDFYLGILQTSYDYITLGDKVRKSINKIIKSVIVMVSACFERVH